VPTADTLRHLLLAPVCAYFTCVHDVVFVYFLGCIFSISVSFICRLTLNKCVILMQHAQLRMRSKPSKSITKIRQPVVRFANRLPV